MLNGGYFRLPTINGDTVVYCCEGDLWSVPAAGGVSSRLTANLGGAFSPALSPDGTRLAFTGQDEQHPEVYVMDAAGGPATRITWLGATASVRGWTADGRIVFISEAGQPFASTTLAYAVAPEPGAQPEVLPFGPVRDVAFQPGGPGVLLGRHTVDPARWKRYRGGTAGNLWIDVRGNGAFRRLIELHTNMGSPMWVGRRVYFISDHEGIGNIYSTRPDGRDLTRHTDHGEYYARMAATDGRRIVYQHAADIWLLDPDHGEPMRIDIDHRSPRVQRKRKFVEAERYLAGFAPHPEGHSIALETRGKLFTMPLFEQAVRQHGAPDGVRYRLARYVGKGDQVVVVSDEGGRDGLEVHRPDDPSAARRIDKVDLGLVNELATSPTEAKAAIANQRNELILVDLDTGKATVIDKAASHSISGVRWSPDGRWLAYSFAATRRTRSIKVCEVASGRTRLVTPTEFNDFEPSWDPKGRYLYFLSARTFDPVYDTVYFDLGFPKAVIPCALALRPDVPSPFIPRPKGLGSPPPDDAPAADDKDGQKAKAAAKDGTKPPEPVTIDFDGIERRVMSFPVPEGRYFQIHGLAEKVLLASSPVEGSLGRGVFDAFAGASGQLDVYDFNEQKHDTLVHGITAFEVARDNATLIYSAGHRLRVIKAGEKPPDGQDQSPPGRASGWIDLGRVRVSIDPPAEWRQMYTEAWRLQTANFWVEDMAGVDWNRVYDRYLPLIDKVSSRGEFSDLMWEMQGELGTSHAYEMGGDHRPPPNYPIGHLGADLALDRRTGRWSFAHIVRGDPWIKDGASPLEAPGIGVTEGDTLLAVGGRPVGPGVHPNELLVNQAGMAVELTVADRRGRNPRTVVVTTVPDERRARYREWVETNRAFVHEATDGRVGYVHVPDMGANGYSEFHRLYFAEVERDGLIVDVRFNGGGHVSQLILEKLARRRIGYDLARWSVPEPYPEDSPGGPMVAITNEQAGSDGDIFTHCFKLLGLGPVVGKRTWGGVIGISPRHLLVDGSIVTQPEASFWFTDVGWGVENYGTDPTHDVDIRPQDYAAGADPQMDKALQLVRQALRRHKPVVPDRATRPDRVLPTLPPR